MSDEPAKYLGAFLGNSDITGMNFEKVLIKARSIAARWRKCSLTLPARITVLKTFIFSVFVHVLNIVEITLAQIDTIQRILNDFLWRGKDRVKFMSVCGSWDMGGLKMLNVKNVVHVLQVKWMIRLYSDLRSMWSRHIWLCFDNLVPLELISGLRCLSESEIQKLPPFYASILRSYIYVNNLFYESSKDKTLQINLWGTTGQAKIKCDWYAAGYFTIVDLPIQVGKLDFGVIADQLRASRGDTYLLCCKFQAQ